MAVSTSNPGRLIGLIMMSASFLLFVLDRVTHSISDFVGKLFCGESYLQAVDGTVGDLSCGFNTDLYLVAGLVLLFVTGLIVNFMSGPHSS